MTGLPSGPSRASSEHIADFERMYADGREPFDYTLRAVEALRHDLVARVARQVEAASVLDLGCGLGQITARLAGAFSTVVAMDLSATAVARAAERVGRALEGRAGAPRELAAAAAGAPRELAAGAGGASPVVFLSGSALELPFRAGCLDLVVASDGLVSWHLNQEQRAAALREILRVLAPGGTVLLTEYIRGHQFDAFVAEVRGAGFETEVVRSVTDRPWYWFESWIRAIHATRVGRALRASEPLARALIAAGRPLGRRSARHILVLARRPGT